MMTMIMHPLHDDCWMWHKIPNLPKFCFMRFMLGARFRKVISRVSTLLIK